MTEKVTIARPYAKAAFEYARQHQAFGRWSQLLARAAAVVTDKTVAPLLGNPKVTPADLVDLIGGVAGNSLDENGRNFLGTLAQNRRLALLPEIAAGYEILRAEVEGVVDVQITSAVALSDAQRERLGAALQKRLKREVRLHCAVDASLIGGAVVRAGDMVIDGSLKAGLERLALDLVH